MVDSGEVGCVQELLEGVLDQGVRRLGQVVAGQKLALQKRKFRPRGWRLHQRLPKSVCFMSPDGVQLDDSIPEVSSGHAEETGGATREKMDPHQG